MKLVWRIAAPFALAAIVWGCGSGGSGGTSGRGGEGGSGGSGGDAGDRTVGEIVVTPAEASLDEGQTLQLEAQVFDTSGEPMSGVLPSWSSSDEEIATVDGEGVVSGLMAGSVTIHAEAGGKRASAAIEVLEVPVSRVKIVLPADATKIGSEVQIRVDHSLGLQAIAYDEDDEPIPGKKITWRSADEEVVRIGPSGIATALHWGRSTITARAGGKSASVETGSVLRFGSVAAGEEHSCAISTGGKVWCWGASIEGSLGNDDPTIRTVSEPVPVAGGRSFETVAVGARLSCAVDTGGRIWCWGAGSGHSLGGEEANEVALQPKPIVLSDAPRFESVSVGIGSACAVGEGQLHCWGALNGGQPPSRLFAESALDFVAVSVGGMGDFACATDGEGRAYCWGKNDWEQVASPASEPVTELAKRPDPYRDYEDLSAGYMHVCASVNDADERYATCWGGGSSGETGSPTYQPSTSNLIFAKKFTGLAAGYVFSCGLEEGVAHCWGRNSSSQLGAVLASGTTSPTPVEVAIERPVRSISAGMFHACALTDKEDALLYCWGSQLRGLLGNGVEGGHALPRMVVGQMLED